MRARDATRYACALLLALACTPASSAAAQLDDTELRLAPDLDVKVLHGYPITRHGYQGPLVFGVELRNRGPERSVQIEVKHPTRLLRTLRVPARERTRAFFTLPARADYGISALFDVSDSRSGKRRALSAAAEFHTDEPVARLGPITSAFNVDKPFILIGALDGRMPDEARALSGVRVIVVEHAYAAAHVRDWRVLLEWVTLGGVLVVSTPAEQSAEPPPWGEHLPFARPERGTQHGVVQEVGHGAIARVVPARLATMSASFLRDIDVCEDCRWSVHESEVNENAPYKQAHQRLRGVVVRPGWGLLGVLALFATAVGPFGWIWLVKRRGWPLRYLGFVLGTALLFSLAVLGHDLIENGIDAKCVARSLVLLDQRNKLELGIEDAALYAPTGRGTRLRLQPGALVLLPTAAFGLELPKPELELSAEREWLEHAVLVRQREIVATRWLVPARGGLEIASAADGLWIENQSGRDLSSLVLWSEGKSFHVPKLARGERARGEPIESRRAEALTPALPKESIVGNGATLAKALIDGELGSNRYVARYGWSTASSSLLGDGVAARPGLQHVIAGVF